MQPLPLSQLPSRGHHSLRSCTIYRGLDWKGVWRSWGTACGHPSQSCFDSDCHLRIRLLPDPTPCTGDGCKSSRITNKLGHCPGAALNLILLTWAVMEGGPIILDAGSAQSCCPLPLPSDLNLNCRSASLVVLNCGIGLPTIRWAPCFHWVPWSPRAHGAGGWGPRRCHFTPCTHHPCCVITLKAGHQPLASQVLASNAVY